MGSRNFDVSPGPCIFVFGFGCLLFSLLSVVASPALLCLVFLCGASLSLSALSLPLCVLWFSLVFLSVWWVCSRLCCLSFVSFCRSFGCACLLVGVCCIALCLLGAFPSPPVVTPLSRPFFYDGSHSTTSFPLERLVDASSATCCFSPLPFPLLLSSSLSLLLVSCWLQVLSFELVPYSGFVLRNTEAPWLPEPWDSDKSLPSHPWTGWVGTPSLASYNYSH